MADETVRDPNDRGANTCKNPPCSCPVNSGEKYCSVHCDSTSGHTQIDCDCGHDSCGGDF